MTYDDLLRVALAAEELGFGVFFRSDHYLGMGTDGLPGPLAISVAQVDR